MLLKDDGGVEEGGLVKKWSGEMEKEGEEGEEDTSVDITLN